LVALREDDLPHYTYKEYSQWEGDWELIGGIAYAMSPSPTIAHQELNLNIGITLKKELKECSHCRVIPEIDWKIDEDTVVRPDMVVVCHLKSDKNYITQPPKMIFEILSPATKHKDRNLKFRLYESIGIPYYIIIEPAGMFAEIYKLEKKSYHLQGTFTTETYRFKIDQCRFDISFEEIFRL